MQQNKPDYPAMLRVLKIIHSALVIIPVIFGVVAFWQNQNPAPEASEELNILLYLPAIFLAMAFPVSAFLFKNNIKQAQLATKTLQQKIAAFQTAHLIRMALFEFAGLSTAVVTLLTGNNYNLVLLALVLGMFVVLMPTPSRIALDLELTADEKEALEG